MQRKTIFNQSINRPRFFPDSRSQDCYPSTTRGLTSANMKHSEGLAGTRLEIVFDREYGPRRLGLLNLDAWHLTNMATPMYVVSFSLDSRTSH